MRYLALLFLFALPQNADKSQMVVPKVTHHDETQTQHYDRVEITCPEGYEGHFVNTEVGFDGMSRALYNGLTETSLGSYVVCFDKKFMDKVRANPELLQPVPPPPRAV